MPISKAMLIWYIYTLAHEQRKRWDDDDDDDDDYGDDDDEYGSFDELACMAINTEPYTNLHVYLD